MEPATSRQLAEIGRSVIARTALSYWYVCARCFRAVQKIRRAANRQSNTDPDETAIAVILATLPKAVERTIGNALTAGTVWFALLPLDIDRFFAAIYFTVEEVEVADLDHAHHRTP